MDTKRKYKNIIILGIIFLLFYIYPLLQLLYAKMIGIDIIYKNEEIILNISDDLSLFLKLLADITFGAMLIIFYRKTIAKDFKEFIHKFGEISDIAIKYWVIGLAIMATSNILIAKFTSLEMATNQESVNNIITSSPILALIITTFCAPFIEELVFRKSFKDAVPSKWPFILTSGIVFGAIHVISTLSTSLLGLLYLIPYCSLGICFGIIYYKTDNIFSTIFIHMIHNGALVLLYILSKGLI